MSGRRGALRRSIARAFVLGSMLSIGTMANAPSAAPVPEGPAILTVRIDSTTHAGPSGIELLHLTPPGQPPLSTLDPDHLDDLKQAFNQAADRTRLMIMVSPTCPHCLNGAREVQKMLADSANTPLRALVVWMYVIHTDRGAPNSIVLTNVRDTRAIQFWDPFRALAHAMMRELPADTAMAMADTTGGKPLIWNLVALWRPGVIWGDKIPAPDFEGHPAELAVPDLRRELGRLSRLTAAASRAAAPAR